MLGGAFEQMAGGFTNDLKYAHYAKLPPRAVLCHPRGHARLLQGRQYALSVGQQGAHGLQLRKSGLRVRHLLRRVRH